MEEKTSLFDLQVDTESSDNLREAAKWSRILAIYGFIFIGLFVLVALAAVAGVGFLGNMFGSGYGSSMAGFVAIIYLFMGLLVFFPVLYMFRFGKNCIHAVENNDQEALISGIANLKSYFKFTGILTTIIVAIYAIIIIVAAFGIAFG